MPYIARMCSKGLLCLISNCSRAVREASMSEWYCKKNPDWYYNGIILIKEREVVFFFQGMKNGKIEYIYYLQPHTYFHSDIVGT